MTLNFTTGLRGPIGFGVAKFRFAQIFTPLQGKRILKFCRVVIVLESVFFNLWAMARGVPTLDGAQGRKQAWRLHVRS